MIKIDKNLKEYQRSIENLAAKRDSMMFSNSGFQHASIVMGNIFEHSDKEVRIFAGNLNGLVSESDYYRNGLANFLNKGGKLKVLLQEYNDESPPKIFQIFKSVDFFYPENVEIKLTNASLSLKSNNKEIHFTVGDESMYRLETDIENYIANGSFNDTETSKNLVSVFDDLYNQADEKIL